MSNLQFDIAAIKNAVITQLDNFYQALKTKDLDTLSTLLTDDGLYCGSDPGEFWGKEEVLKEYAQMFEDESFKFDSSIDKREIRLNADGESAISIEQFIWDQFSPKIPFRSICHFVKIGNNWKIDFFSASLVAKNADMGKLNKVLE